MIANVSPSPVVHHHEDDVWLVCCIASYLFASGSLIQLPVLKNITNSANTLVRAIVGQIFIVHSILMTHQHEYTTPLSSTGVMCSIYMICKLLVYTQFGVVSQHSLKNIANKHIGYHKLKMRQVLFHLLYKRSPETTIFIKRCITCLWCLLSSIRIKVCLLIFL